MGKHSVFSSVEDAIGTTWRFIPRLAKLWLWMLIAMAHLALLYLMALAAWLFQWTPQETSEWMRQALHSKAFATYLWLGGSALGVAAMYWKLIRWTHRASYSGWLFRYLNKDD